MATGCQCPGSAGGREGTGRFHGSSGLNVLLPITKGKKQGRQVFYDRLESYRTMPFTCKNE